MEYKGYSCLYCNRWHAKVSMKSLHQGRIQWANLMQGHNIKRGLRVNCGEQNHLTGLLESHLLLLSKHNWGLKDAMLQMHEAWAQKAHSDGNELCLYITNEMQTENRDVLLMRQHCSYRFRVVISFGISSTEVKQFNQAYLHKALKERVCMALHYV